MGWRNIIYIEISEFLYKENRKVDYYKQQSNIGQVTGVLYLKILLSGNNDW
jgi:hypothetical protein